MNQTPIQVISLPASHQRRSAFQQHNAHIHYEFFDAIVGADLTTQAIADSGLFEPNLPYTKGAYGSAISHLRLWEKAIETQEMVTIVEDDAIFRLDFHAHQMGLIESLPADWDIVLWGWNFDSILSLAVMPGVSPAVVHCDQNQLRQSVDTFVTSSSALQLFRLHQCFGLVAYTVSPAGAKKFKSSCFPQKKTRFSIQDWAVRLEVVRGI